MSKICLTRGFAGNKSKKISRRNLLKGLKVLEQLANNESEVKVFWFTTETQRRQLGNLIVEATHAIISDREQAQDSGNWQGLMMFRIGYPTVKALPSPRRAVNDVMRG